MVKRVVSVAALLLFGALPALAQQPSNPFASPQRPQAAPPPPANPYLPQGNPFGAGAPFDPFNPNNPNSPFFPLTRPKK